MSDRVQVDADIPEESRPYFWASYFAAALAQIVEAASAPWRPDDEVRAAALRAAAESLADYEASAYIADRQRARRELGLPVMEVR